jgi:hypothetical protein
MIDLADLITYIDTNTTGMSVKVADGVVPDLLDSFAAPVISVGYTTIASSNPSSIYEQSIMQRNGDDLVQGFEIYIDCTHAVFRSTWITLYNLLIDWVPYPTDQVHARFTFNNGGRMGSSTQRIFFVNNWNVAFPTNKVLI